ncbi:hypothetical protein B0H17DRAFT_1145222 [Mycena rosella]|uniref:Uncharacterized protein n=1 Tax=Mycena rosella TaxID=1033263 RepID=A0AAD7G654_MYCRO|nr:hypothetical protein B0H17DRAFT_1145222 [Mycena rosella]
MPFSIYLTAWAPKPTKSRTCPPKFRSSLMLFMMNRFIQECVSNCSANDPDDLMAVTHVRDLFEEGAKYADGRSTFKKFMKEERRAQNSGFVDSVCNGTDTVDSEGDESEQEEEYEITQEDL